MADATPRYFPTPADFRRWLLEHHEHATELWVGYHKKASGTRSITWPESVDEALCVGWIDGLRKSIDESRYMIRFTPRRPRSIWSAVNLRRVEALIAEGRMQPAGLRAFEARTAERSAIYSFEQQAPARLPPEAQARFEADAEAWTWFTSQPAGYRNTALWWVLSAKRDETRSRRLDTLIADSRAQRRIAQLRR